VAVPISLYLQLEENKTADLEVIARASLAFASAIKEVAYIIDPRLEIRVELLSGTEGSLSLNSFLRNISKKPGEAITLGAIALIVLSWFGNHALDYAFEKSMDAVAEAFHLETGEKFSEAQKAELAAIVQKAEALRPAEPQVQRVYREIERDPTITGIGATSVAGERPDVILPRTEFRARAGQGRPVEETLQRRVMAQQVRVGLISPVLIPGNRRWKLKGPQGEFGAVIKDQAFINSVLSGTTSVRMKTGIEMVVELETVEEFKNGVWEIVERDVTEVYDLIEPPQQSDLWLEPDNGDPDSN
jgi:hypothetical protein